MTNGYKCVDSCLFPYEKLESLNLLFFVVLSFFNLDLHVEASDLTQSFDQVIRNERVGCVALFSSGILKFFLL
jgi:hypothetical protein